MDTSNTKQKHRLLIVDDDPFILQSMQLALEQRGYLVHTAASGEAAAEQLRQETFDLVLTDLALGVLDGIGVLKIAKRLRPCTRVIILTGYGSLPSAIDAIRSGADDYMLKPCEIDEISFRIARSLDNLALQREIEQAYLNLEKRIQERTAALSVANTQLQREIEERRRTEKELLLYQGKLRSLSAELVFTEERERRRLATELHDRIGQALALSNIKLDVLRESTPDAGFVSQLDEIRRLIAQTIQDTRTLTFELSPPVLYDVGLSAAVQWLLEQMRQQHKIQFTLANERQVALEADWLRVLIFQATRELLFNVVKHAGAQHVRVAIRQEHQAVRIVVQDDGVGFDATMLNSHRHDADGFGLFSIRERLNHLGGRLKVFSRPGRGTKVTLFAPTEPPLSAGGR